MKVEDIKSVADFFKRADEAYFVNNATKNFFTKTNNLYTLFCVDMLLKGDIPSKKLDTFVDSYQAQHDNPYIEKYREGASSRTRSGEQRNRRVDALRQWILL
ncbi:hypothetical protein FV226_11180 [Methylobacterium sp. WL12]|nr:hypothetical protein FV226_11180 [Methylobacterium sp. WL12]